LRLYIKVSKLLGRGRSAQRSGKYVIPGDTA
jgi:hypothetical protein